MVLSNRHHGALTPHELATQRQPGSWGTEESPQRERIHLGKGKNLEFPVIDFL